MRTLIVLSMACLALAANFAAAQERAQVSTTQPVVLSADRLIHDQKTDTVTAMGNVEISQGNRILIADKVVFRQSDGKVTAEGNVALLEPTGEVIYSQSTELTDNMKNGVIKQLRVLLSDKSRLNAESAVRTEGNRTELSQASYSACNLCPVDPSAAPMWQIKAESVVHDQEAKSVVYHNAWFEVFGVPIAYTPYFRHADPTAKRKSGLLTPSFRSEEHTSELQSHSEISYAVFCLKKKKK